MNFRIFPKWLILAKVLLDSSDFVFGIKRQTKANLSRWELVCLMVDEMSCDSYLIDNIKTTCIRREDNTPQIAPQSHGLNCSQQEECSFKDSVCFEGICLCKPGLYFSQTQTACLRECPNYGKKMDVYAGLSIKGHNYYRERNKDLGGCVPMCVKKSNCRTFDYRRHDGWCHLASVGFLDVNDAEREFNLSDWVLGQRRCT